MEKSILVTGSGVTSRANVEALVDDYFYAYPKLDVFIAVHGAVTEGQVWMTQYAIDKEKSVIVFMTEGASLMGIPASVERHVSDSPVASILELDVPLEALVLWNDEDSVCLDTLALCAGKGVAVRNLAEGLHEIIPAEDIKQTPKVEMPESEVISIEESLESDVEDLDEEDDGEYEDPLYEAIHIIAKIFAEAIAKELTPTVLRKVTKNEKP